MKKLSILLPILFLTIASVAKADTFEARDDCNLDSSDKCTLVGQVGGLTATIDVVNNKIDSQNEDAQNEEGQNITTASDYTVKFSGIVTLQKMDRTIRKKNRSIITCNILESAISQTCDDLNFAISTARFYDRKG